MYVCVYACVCVCVCVCDLINKYNEFILDLLSGTVSPSYALMP